jgi:hypothetical protein
MTGRDVGPRAHVDTNYTIGAIGDAGGRGHFVEQVLSASMSLTVTERLSPYFEGFGISREEIGGGLITAIDTGAIYTIGRRMAVDGGVLVGISRDASPFAAFGGFSVALGHARACKPSGQSRSRLRVATSASAARDRGADPRP